MATSSDVPTFAPGGNVCKCKVKAKSGPKCSICGRLFHPACAEKYKCCGITVCAKYDPAEDSVTAMSFLRSSSFAELLSSIIKAETSELRSEISMLRSELQILKDSNVELIKMLSGATNKNLVDNNAENVRFQTYRDITSKTQQHFLSQKTTANSDKAAINVPESSNPRQMSTAVFTATTDVHPCATEKMSNDNKRDESNENASNVNKEQNSWLTVSHIKKGKPPQKSLIGTGKSAPGSAKITGALQRKWMYVGRISGKDVSEEDIMDYLKQIDGHEQFLVKKLDTKGNNSAFSVGAPSNLYDKIFDPDFWPESVSIRHFNVRPFLRNRQKINNSK